MEIGTEESARDDSTSDGECTPKELWSHGSDEDVVRAIEVALKQYGSMAG
jgi:hypothetical protein